MPKQRLQNGFAHLALMLRRRLCRFVNSCGPWSCNSYELACLAGWKSLFSQRYIYPAGLDACLYRRPVSRDGLCCEALRKQDHLVNTNEKLNSADRQCMWAAD